MWGYKFEPLRKQQVLRSQVERLQIPEGSLCGLNLHFEVLDFSKAVKMVLKSINVRLIFGSHSGALGLN
jgi:hypothetical protein